MRPLYLALAFAVATGLTFYIHSLLNSQQQPVQVQVIEQVNPVIQQQTQTKILLAKKHLPVGYLLQPADLEFKPWPADAVREGFLKEDGGAKITDLAGSVVRVEMAAGEPIQRIKLVAPGERGFLAAVLRPGMKAVAIPVSNRTAVANLVMPGDRVDVMLTQALQRSSGQGTGTEPEQITETIVYNARVLATGQSLSPVQNTPEGQPQPAPVTGYDTLTLELTPKLAEIVTLANELGRLSIALNPIAGPESDVKANHEAEERLKQWPYGVQGVTGAGGPSVYSFTIQGEASPARKRTGSESEGASGISIYRGGAANGVTATPSGKSSSLTQ